MVIEWSIRVAEWLVQRVGLVIVWRKPVENNESIYVEVVSEELYLRASMLMSPSNRSWEEWLNEVRVLRRISLNWLNCSDWVRVEYLELGRYNEPRVSFLLKGREISMKIYSYNLEMKTDLSLRSLKGSPFLR